MVDIFRKLGIEKFSRAPEKKSAQQIVDESGALSPRARAEAIQKAKEGMRKESISKFKSYFTRPQQVSPGIKRLERKVGSKLRKAVHLSAPKKSMVRRLTAPAGKKVKGRGRGRPRQTYKTRVLPSGKIVKVPTHIYKKMLSQEKAAIRLAAAQRQASFQQQMEAEQIAAQTDPRFQPKDAFLEAPDMEHEQEVADLKQRMLQQQYLQQMQQQVDQEQRPSISSRAKQMFSNVGRISLMGTDRQAQMLAEGQTEDLMSRPHVPQIHRPPVQPVQRPQVDSFGRSTSPQVLVASGKSPMFSRGGPSILSQRNEFNRRGEATIGFGRW